ncbi:MAG: S9 family peptidase, partial [Myxococcales bacterium]|nr:S9 family peptidase [Myxococcales bacterium]
DENALARGSTYFDLASLSVSPNHRWCAYAVDDTGDEVYTIRVLDLDTGERLADVLEDCADSLAWADDETLFYTRMDASMRPCQAWRHRLGTPPQDDPCVYEEPDRRFYLGLHRTRSGAFIVMGLDSQVTSEVWLIPTRAPTAAPVLVEARREGVEYGVAHRGEHLLVLTNDGAINFRVELRPIPGAAGPGVDVGARRSLIPGRADVLIEDLDVFADHLVVWERHAGLPRLRVVPLDPLPERIGDDAAPAPGEHLIAFPDPTYSLWGAMNCEFETRVFRFGYASLTTPDSIYDYDLVSRERSLRKRTEVGGGHDPARFASARIWATAADGERVPISLVWRRDGEPERARPSRPRPLVLYAYGAYGDAMDAAFSRPRLSMLERGAIWAIAHVRGGGELGRRWYEAGKLRHKHNTFGDYIACADLLVAEGWTTPEQLAAWGDSAGGLLVGAVVNARPGLFAALVAGVPFVDVINSMLDEDLPLTIVEREEWGDPRQAEDYAWLRAYSPYENVRAQAYPAMFVIAGWNDPRVGYWEPAKWVARLRERKTDDREILLWTNMDAGHAGATGRFEYLRELART